MDWSSIFHREKAAYCGRPTFRPNALEQSAQLINHCEGTAFIILRLARFETHFACDPGLTCWDRKNSDRTVSVSFPPSGEYRCATLRLRAWPGGTAITPALLAPAGKNRILFDLHVVARDAEPAR